MKIIRFLCLFALTAVAYAQSCPAPIGQTGSSTAWAGNAAVQVVLSGFSSTAQIGINSVLGQWGNAGNSGVTFNTVSSYSGSGPVMYISNVVPPTAAGGGRAQGSENGYGNGTDRTVSFININPGITNATAFQQTVSHEVGHSMGLGHCPLCAAGTSAMTLPPSADLNATGGSSSPTQMTLGCS